MGNTYIIDSYYCLERDQLLRRLSLDEQWRLIEGFIDHSEGRKMDVVTSLLGEFERRSAEQSKCTKNIGWARLVFFVIGTALYFYVHVADHLEHLIFYAIGISICWTAALLAAGRELVLLIANDFDRTNWIKSRLQAMALDLEKNQAYT